MFSNDENTKTTSSSPIHELVVQLIAEPYAEAEHLAEATLDQLGRALEEASGDYERADLPQSLQDVAASFHRCKEIYCQILLDLENLTSESWSQKTLAELCVPVVVENSAPEMESPPLSPMEEDGVEPTVITDLGTLEAEAQASEIEDSAMMSPQFEATSSTPETPIPDLEPPPQRIEFNNTAPAPAAPRPSIPKMVQRDLGFGQRAKELQLLSEWFGSIAPTEPSAVDSTQLGRIATQLLGGALEVECWERMREGILKVWEKREGAVKRLFDTKKNPWSLPQGTRDQMSQLEKALLKKPFKRPLPFFAMENSLRYLLTVPKLENFYPSLLDAGTLLFFFGQKRELREYQLENHFWTQEGTVAEVTEASLRLIRYHEQHKRSLTPWFSKEKGELMAPAEAEEEAEKILALFDATGLRRGR